MRHLTEAEKTELRRHHETLKTCYAALRRHTTADSDEYRELLRQFLEAGEAMTPFYRQALDEDGNEESSR